MGRILIVNDDGINALGIKVLVEVLKDYSLLVVAPEYEYSGAGHAITIKSPLFYKKIDNYFDHPDCISYAVKGTPADCTKLGLFYFAQKQEIDLVISGINNGLNVGVDIFYSGTVAGAREAAFSGKKAVSMSSFAGSGEDDFRKATNYFLKLLPVLKEYDKGFLLNLNFPRNFKLPIQLAKVSDKHIRSVFEERKMPSSKKPYLWLVEDKISPDAGSDLYFTTEGYATATFLRPFPSSYQIERLKAEFEIFS